MKAGLKKKIRYVSSGVILTLMLLLAGVVAFAEGTGIHKVDKDPGSYGLLIEKHVAADPELAAQLEEVEFQVGTLTAKLNKDNGWKQWFEKDDDKRNAPVTITVKENTDNAEVSGIKPEVMMEVNGWIAEDEDNGIKAEKDLTVKVKIDEVIKWNGLENLKYRLLMDDENGDMVPVDDGQYVEWGKNNPDAGTEKTYKGQSRCHNYTVEVQEIYEKEGIRVTLCRKSILNWDIKIEGMPGLAGEAEISIFGKDNQGYEDEALKEKVDAGDVLERNVQTRYDFSYVIKKNGAEIFKLPDYVAGIIDLKNEFVITTDMDPKPENADIKISDMSGTNLISTGNMNKDNGWEFKSEVLDGWNDEGSLIKYNIDYSYRIKGAELKLVLKSKPNMKVFITNVYESASGDLTIKKKVDDNDIDGQNREFSFRADLKDERGNPLSGDFVYTYAPETGMDPFTGKIPEKLDESSLPEVDPYWTADEGSPVFCYYSIDNRVLSKGYRNNIGWEYYYIEEAEDYFKNPSADTPVIINRWNNGYPKEYLKYLDPSSKQWVYRINGPKVSVTGGNISFKLKHNQSVTILGLPKGTAYTVTEDDPDYNMSVNGIVSAKVSGTIESSKEAVLDIKNVRRKPGSLTVFKNWENDGGSSVRPQAIKVRLLKNGVLEEEVLLREPSWTYTWEDLEEADDTGNPYIYTVEEVDVPEGYEVSYINNGVLLTGGGPGFFQGAAAIMEETPKEDGAGLPLPGEKPATPSSADVPEGDESGEKTATLSNASRKRYRVMTQFVTIYATPSSADQRDPDKGTPSDGQKEPDRTLPEHEPKAVFAADVGSGDSIPEITILNTYKETPPTEPETSPSEPETSPSEPETRPTEPETRPTEPGTRPTEPETRPTEPGTRPTEPETRPTEPGTRPTEPETTPGRTAPTPPPETTAPVTETATPPEETAPPSETLPDPNDPNSPDTVTIVENGVPKTYRKVWDPEKQEFVYILDEEVPLDRMLPKTGDTTRGSAAGVLWIVMWVAVAVLGYTAYRSRVFRKR